MDLETRPNMIYTYICLFQYAKSVVIFFLVQNFVHQHYLLHVLSGKKTIHNTLQTTPRVQILGIFPAAHPETPKVIDAIDRPPLLWRFGQKEVKGNHFGRFLRRFWLHKKGESGFATRFKMAAMCDFFCPLPKKSRTSFSHLHEVYLSTSFILVNT